MSKPVPGEATSSEIYMGDAESKENLVRKFLDGCVILKVSRAKTINKLGKLGLSFSEFPWSLFFFLLMEDTKLHAA